MGISNKCDIHEAQWGITDIILVFLIVIVVSVGLLISFFIFVENRKTQFVLFSYTFSLLSFFTPYVWLKRKYKLGLDALGWKKGKHNYKRQFTVATLAAFAMFCIVAITSSPIEAVITKKAVEIKSILALLIVPFTITGITKFILTPIGEELLLRGFLYGYLRRRFSFQFAIIIQAIFSTTLHIAYIKEAFISGNFLLQISYLLLINFVLGCIYEVSKSLYPSILCHGLYNFLLFMYPIFL